jgi:hypothetical protein
MSKDITAWKMEGPFLVPQYDDGGFVEGTQDVLQRVLCLLLMEPGSKRYGLGREVEWACPFMSSWRHGEITNEAQLMAAFTLSQAQISQVMRDQESEDDGPEQKFKKLTLEKIVIQPGTVQLHCTLETGAGKLPFILPMPK